MVFVGQNKTNAADVHSEKLVDLRKNLTNSLMNSIACFAF